jgi:hypothetical protein
LESNLRFFYLCQFPAVVLTRALDGARADGTGRSGVELLHCPEAVDTDCGVQWLWTVGLKTAYHLMAGRISASNRRADDRAVKRVILEFIINGVVVRSPILERGMT